MCALMQVCDTVHTVAHRKLFGLIRGRTQKSGDTISKTRKPQNCDSELFQKFRDRQRSKLLRANPEPFALQRAAVFFVTHRRPSCQARACFTFSCFPMQSHMHSFEEFLQQPLVFGPQWPNEHFRAVADVQPLFPFFRIGTHRESIVSDTFELRLRIERRDGDADVEGEDPVLIGEQRVDVEFAQFRHIGGKLRELNESQSDIRHPGGGNVAVALEHARDPRPGNQFAGHLEVERGQRQRLVVEHLDGGRHSKAQRLCGLDIEAEQYSGPLAGLEIGLIRMRDRCILPG
jgi:hypothetical protein